MASADVSQENLSLGTKSYPEKFEMMVVKGRSSLRASSGPGRGNRVSRIMMPCPSYFRCNLRVLLDNGSLEVKKI